MEDETTHKAAFDEAGNLILKNKKNIKRGGISRAQGAAFELRVRKDLQEKGWTVDKWSNNIDTEKDEITPAKRKMQFLGQGQRIMTIGTGFPDFIAFKEMDNGLFKVIGVEVKINNKLSKIEKEKCQWYLKRKTFSELWVAYKEKEKNRVKVIYRDIDIKE
ncbi:MAG: hypothetical protein ACI83O_000935 [Patescibacteria group bacterium]|jgi:hypothetical protein